LGFVFSGFVSSAFLVPLRCFRVFVTVFRGFVVMELPIHPFGDFMYRT